MKHENFELIENEEIPFHDKCMCILKNSITLPCMKASWFVTAVNAFVHSKCRKCIFMEQCMYGAVELCDIEKSIIEDQSDFVIIPIILQSYLCHMTVIIVDRPRKRIVYYDPYGTSPIGEIRVISNVVPKSMGVLHMLCTIANLTQFSVTYSARHDQSMLYPFQCGAFSKAFIERAILFPNQIAVLPL